MTSIDWGMFGLGGLTGAGAAAIYFLGLALGLRLALGAARPVPVLILSGAVRIALLLAVIWLVVQSGLAALAGFAPAFLGVRFVVMAFARPALSVETRACN
jgi:hypothetical protein